MFKYKIIPFDKNYQKDDFDCGIDELNRYLKKYASQDIKRRIAQIFIIIAHNSEQIIGFYSLSAGSIKAESLPEKIAKKLPKYPVPICLLGRLAVDKNYQGKGMGKLLLADAIKRVIKAREFLAIYALVVDAKNESAKMFYLRYGFQKLIGNRLFLPLTTFPNI
jgi:GNAT superfamily N-acetyltransferase